MAFAFVVPETTHEVSELRPQPLEKKAFYRMIPVKKELLQVTGTFSPTEH